MSDWFDEIWLVFSHSTKIQMAVIFGMIFFVGIMLLGQTLVGNLELHGPLAPLTNLIQGQLMHRYDKAAWMALGGFLLVAIKSYRKERSRILGI